MFDLALVCSIAATLASAGAAIWSVERYRAFNARLADVERAFPAWHAELAKMATVAAELYAEARDQRERAQRVLAGRASGAARAAPLEDEPPPDEAGRREWREAKKAAIAAGRR
jgi:hypothetical protein